MNTLITTIKIIDIVLICLLQVFSEHLVQAIYMLNFQEDIYSAVFSKSFD